MTKRLLYTYAVIVLGAACLYAQLPITAEIPFPFHVGNSILPAGSYTADTNIASGAVLRLRAAEGKSGVMAVSNGVYAPGRTQPRFVFNKYGDEYFLFQVWTDASGHQLVQTRHEAELAAAAKRNVQTVVASR
jgi:hypothetical protein